MTERNCGDCTLCCKVMAIETLAKPAGTWCSHCRPGCGCLIYETRPTECLSYSCLWLTDKRFGQHRKPNKSKIVLTASEDGIEVRCDPGFLDAWRKEPFLSQFRLWARQGTIVSVFVADRVTHILPSGEEREGKKTSLEIALQHLQNPIGPTGDVCHAEICLTWHPAAEAKELVGRAVLAVAVLSLIKEPD